MCYYKIISNIRRTKVCPAQGVSAEKIHLMNNKIERSGAYDCGKKELTIGKKYNSIINRKTNISSPKENEKYGK